MYIFSPEWKLCPITARVQTKGAPPLVDTDIKNEGVKKRNQEIGYFISKQSYQTAKQLKKEKK